MLQCPWAEALLSLVFCHLAPGTVALLVPGTVALLMPGTVALLPTGTVALLMPVAERLSDLSSAPLKPLSVLMSSGCFLR